jgi:hypothetical protein
MFERYFGHCKYDNTLNMWANEHTGERCYYVTTFEYMCAYAQDDGTWVEYEDVECPEALSFVDPSNVPDSNNHEGFFFPWAEPEPEWDEEQHKWVECFYNESTSPATWTGYDHHAMEAVRCPQSNLYDGSEVCKDGSDGNSYTSDGAMCPNLRWEWDWACTYDADYENWRDSDSRQCDWSTTYYFVCWGNYADQNVVMETPYMIYHAHWLEHNLDPMPVYFHFNGDGDCKFSIGGADS